MNGGLRGLMFGGAEDRPTPERPVASPGLEDARRWRGARNRVGTRCTGGQCFIVDDPFATALHSEDAPIPTPARGLESRRGSPVCALRGSRPLMGRGQRHCVRWTHAYRAGRLVGCHSHHPEPILPLSQLLTRALQVRGVRRVVASTTSRLEHHRRRMPPPFSR